MRLHGRFCFDSRRVTGCCQLGAAHHRQHGICEPVWPNIGTPAEDLVLRIHRVLHCYHATPQTAQAAVGHADSHVAVLGSVLAAPPASLRTVAAADMYLAARGRDWQAVRR